MKLNIELFGSSFYYTINRLSLKLFEVLSLWILIKILAPEDIGIIGVAVGFISILNLLNIQPYRKMFQTFEDFRSRLNDHLSSYILFWFLQSFIMLLLAGVAAAWYAQSGYGESIFFVMAGLVLAYLFSNLQLLLQEVFFIHLKQKMVTYFNVVFTILFLISLLLLFQYPSVELYAILLSIKAILTSICFFFLARKEIKFVFGIPADFKKIITKSIKDFAVWDHLISASLDLVNKVFLFFLGLFALQTIVGEVTIALSLANFLTFFPLVVYRTSMLAITRVKSHAGLEKVLTAFTKYSALVGIIQFVIFVAALNPIIAFFAPTAGPELWMHAFLIGLATSILQMGHPIHAMALFKTDIRAYFMHVILPITLVAILGYLAVSLVDYPAGVGIIFVLATLAINVASYLFVKRTAGLHIRKVLFFPEEKEVLDHLSARIMGK